MSDSSTRPWEACSICLHIPTRVVVDMLGNEETSVPKQLWELPGLEPEVLTTHGADREFTCAECGSAYNVSIDTDVMEWSAEIVRQESAVDES